MSRHLCKTGCRFPRSLGLFPLPQCSHEEGGQGSRELLSHLISP